MIFGESHFLLVLTYFIPLLMCLTVHEWAHAWSAYQLGDDTAKLMGRMTLNPLDHIDPVGTLIPPLLGIPFGWAKPVPFEPLRFRRTIPMQLGTMIVAVAGPISNFCLAALSLGLFLIAAIFEPELGWLGPAVLALLRILVFMNILLALFNLMPIPPLDGGYLADYLMPEIFRPAWNQFRSVGGIALLFIIAMPFVLGVSIFGGIVLGINGQLDAVLTWARELRMSEV